MLIGRFRRERTRSNGHVSAGYRGIGRRLRGASRRRLLEVVRAWVGASRLPCCREVQPRELRLNRLTSPGNSSLPAHNCARGYGDSSSRTPAAVPGQLVWPSPSGAESSCCASSHSARTLKNPQRFSRIWRPSSSDSRLRVRRCQMSSVGGVEVSARPPGLDPPEPAGAL